MNDGDEYRVYLMPFPGDIRAAVRLDDEGFPSIYINDKLSPEAKKRAFLHELKHIKRNDHYNERRIEDVEHDAAI
jgi:Zn-dependent peptidase ImmA (M78 family)